MIDYPKIYFHILAKDKAKILPYWLEQNLNNLDYPRDKVVLSFRTNNNNDDTADIIERWIDEENLLASEEYVGWEGDKAFHRWSSIYFDDSDIPEPVQEYGVHEWNALRFKALARLRQEGIEDAQRLNAWYFVVDVDNFLLPGTLKALVEANKSVIAPLLRYAVAQGEETHAGYANFHHPVTENGYYQDSEEYFALLNGAIRGVYPVDLVHCTYLIRPDILPLVQYQDGTEDYEYVIFSRNLRKQDIPQYLDNRQIYGYLTLWENLDACKHWMEILSDNQRRLS